MAHRHEFVPPRVKNMPSTINSYLLILLLQTFQSDMLSRQQILHAIIREGQQLMASGEVEEQPELEKKLKLLQEQWEGVVRRAQQRKAILDNSVSQWQTYTTQKDRLQVKEYFTSHCTIRPT